MIVIKGWTCFHCGAHYPNRVIICEMCNATKKHSNNMRQTLGMDVKPMVNKKGESHSKEDKEKYGRFKTKLESVIVKFFLFSLKLHAFRDRSNRVLTSDNTLYHGFNDDGYHYTIRRDKI